MKPQPAPDFPPGQWLQDHRVSLRALRGRVVLVWFWDYAQSASLRALPIVRAWAARYNRLSVVGIHAPEFAFGRERALVEWAAATYEASFPVYMDNDYLAWRAFGMRGRPGFALIDVDGQIRWRGRGLDDLAACERLIITLLREADPLYEPPPPIAPDDHASIAEMRAGYDGGSLGSAEGYARSAPILYNAPDATPDGAFYVQGAWQASPEFIAFQGSSEGKGILYLPYLACEVSAVFAPHYDVVERMLHPDPVAVEVWQDNRPLDDAMRGEDVTADGRIIIDRPRLYRLIRAEAAQHHTLALRAQTRGFAVYAFALVGA